MSMSDLVGLALNQTVSWERKTGVNAYAESTFAAPKDIDCRVSVKNRLVLNKEGQEVTSTAQVTTLDPVSIGDRITVRGQSFIVIAVTIPATFAGADHRRKVFI